MAGMVSRGVLFLMKNAPQVCCLTTRLRGILFFGYKAILLKVITKVVILLY